VAADKAALPGLEKEIKANPKIALVTGDAYYGYADYAKAAGLYRQAIGAANVDQATANLRLGMALAKSGDKAGATKALQSVTGGPREALAKYWLLYLNQPAA
jgi:predicted Zn-dependent protease